MQAGRLRMAGADTTAFLVLVIPCTTFGMGMNGNEKPCNSFDPKTTPETIEDMIRYSWTVVMVMGKTNDYWLFLCLVADY